MHIHVERVDERHLLGKVLILWENERSACIRSIAVDPDVWIVPHYIGDGIEIIYGASVGRADRHCQVVRM